MNRSKGLWRWLATLAAVCAAPLCVAQSGVAAQDAVIDFNATVRDPANPARLRPAYDFDGVHLTDAGYEAMANAVNLAMLF